MEELKNLMLTLSYQINRIECKIYYLTTAIEANMESFCSKDGAEKTRKWFKDLKDASEKSCKEIELVYKKMYPDTFGDDNGSGKL